MLFKIMRFMKGRRGQGMVEYGIVAALVGIACIAAFSLFGGQIRYVLHAMAAQLSGQTDQGVINDQVDQIEADAFEYKTLEDFGNND